MSLVQGIALSPTSTSVCGSQYIYICMHLVPLLTAWVCVGPNLLSTLLHTLFNKSHLEENLATLFGRAKQVQHANRLRCPSALHPAWTAQKHYALGTGQTHHALPVTFWRFAADSAQLFGCFGKAASFVCCSGWIGELSKSEFSCQRSPATILNDYSGALSLKVCMAHIKCFATASVLQRSHFDKGVASAAPPLLLHCHTLSGGNQYGWWSPALG